MDPFVHSRLLTDAGARHGFSTRAGGVSEGPFAALNLSASVGDDPERVAENVRRLHALAGVEAIATVRQVHGDRVLESPPDRDAEADGLLATRGAVGVKVADCVPVLLFDPITGIAAAVHAGWRGVAARIAARAVEALCAQGSRAGELLAALGPHIQACCYQVGEDLAERFTRDFGAQVVRRDDGRARLDLARGILQALESAGLDPAHIERLPHCTSCDPARFFSHRRDRGRTGRHLAYIEARPVS